MAYTASDRDLPAHQAWQQQVAGGAEFFVLPIQVGTLLIEWLGNFPEQLLQPSWREQERQRCQISPRTLEGAWLLPPCARSALGLPVNCENGLGN
jgi:hypothetical protein